LASPSDPAFGGTPSDTTSGGPTTPPTGGDGQVAAGTLTAGTWDDNLNFAFFETYRDGLGLTDGIPSFTAEEQTAANVASQSRTPKGSLDIALVIDTTGSMGDEISYLKAEFSAIAASIATRYPGVPQRWALIAYRDVVDDYIWKGVDFGTSASWLQQHLDPLVADGGGDFPEAADQALAQAVQLSWNPDAATARIVFWVADAPPHTTDMPAFASAIESLRDEGVHVYPVAASGIDAATEYTMRASAQLTLGRYVFLTDDSGVGDTHEVPEIPCFVVTKLDYAMKRVVASELSGTIDPVDTADVLRTVGSPTNGSCALETTNVSLF
jgi:hypothetical protein